MLTDGIAAEVRLCLLACLKPLLISNHRTDVRHTYLYLQWLWEKLEVIRLWISFRKPKMRFSEILHFCLLQTMFHVMDDFDLHMYHSNKYFFFVCVCPGAVGVVWFVFWALFVFDSPNTHPRISERERLYITSSLKNEVTKNHTFMESLVESLSDKFLKKKERKKKALMHFLFEKNPQTLPFHLIYLKDERGFITSGLI